MAVGLLFNDILQPFHNIQSALLSLFVLFTALYGIAAIFTWYPLRHFKGPWFASFSELWLARVTLSGRMGATFVELNKEYGHLARIGPQDLMTDDADIIRYISDPKKSGFVRSDWYTVSTADPDNHNVFSTTDTEYHNSVRAQMTPGYGRKENPELEQGIDETILTMFDLIGRKYLSTASNTVPMDLGKISQYFTLDAITKVTFGDAFGFLSKDEDVHQLISNLEPLVPTVTMIGSAPTLRRLLRIRRVFALVNPLNDRTKGFGKLITLAEDLVRKRLNDEEKHDMLGSFMRHGLNEKQLVGCINLQLIAGSDTTATAIRATLLHLITQPRILSRIRKEMDDAVASGRASRPVIQSSEAKSLPYLQACIREGLRIHAPTAPLLSKEAGPEGATIGGKYIPPGTRIAHNGWGFLRNAALFGEDVDVYRPERWLDEGMGGDRSTHEERRMRMLKDLDLLFGFGKWYCLGKSIAETELNKVFFELLYRYDITVNNPGRAWTFAEYNVNLIRDFWVRVTMRDQ